jgi:hypothetical protein
MGLRFTPYGVYAQDGVLADEGTEECIFEAPHERV